MKRHPHTTTEIRRGDFHARRYLYGKCRTWHQVGNRLDVDTRDYDLTLLKVWEVVSVEEEDNAYWSSFDSFDDFMCSWLV